MPRKATRKLEWVRPPRQARSHRTLERILDAAEAIVVEEGAQGVTVAEVARRAGSSVGAFYARFPDKEALLQTLFARFHEQAIATTDAVLAPARWEGVPVREFLRVTVGFLVRVCRERGRFLAAFARRSDPDLHQRGRELGEHVAARVIELVESRADRIGHPDPQAGIHFCIWTMLGSLQSRALQTEVDEPPLIPDEVVAAEFTRMALAYLQVD